MIIFKLALIIIFLFFSSKSFGIFIEKKLGIKKEISLGLGYLVNIALFFGFDFFVCFQKLSSMYLNIAGIFYLLICLIFIFLSIKDKQLFKFSKKELIAIGFGLIFLILFYFFIDFGYIDTYDSYYYSLLTNSTSDVSKVSVIDPYTGLSNMANFYKYMTVYNQASFLSNLFNIKNAYLVLIWCFTFMNYYFIAITALGVARISKKEYVNNIISVFILTFALSFFRAPFNFLHIVTMIIPFYACKYAFGVLEDRPHSLKLFLITSIAAVACTSTVLFTLLPLVYIILIVNSILKKKDNFGKIYYMSIPTAMLAFLYLYEATNSNVILISGFALITIIAFLLRSKIINNIINSLGQVLMVVLPLFFIVVPYFDDFATFGTEARMSFMKRDALPEDEVVSNNDENIMACINGGTYNVDASSKYSLDMEKHGSSMNYIYSDNSSTISKTLIMITHTFIKYCGLLFLLIYGFIKLREKPLFVGLIVYLVTFFNPFVFEGYNELLSNLGNRTTLFLSAYFAIHGFNYLCDYIDGIKFTKFFGKLWEIIKKYSLIIYILLFTASTMVYIMDLKKTDFNSYSSLYKVPNSFIELSEEINSIKTEKKLRVFYTASTFSVSYVDKNINDKIRIMNTNNYQSFFTNYDYITDKLIINIFFETNGNVGFNDLVDIANDNKKYFNIDYCNIESLIKYYGIDIIVTTSTQDKEFKNWINENYEIVYDNNEFMIINVRSV